MAIIPLAVVGTSLLGSGHCVAMCGGLMMSVSKSRRSLILYHLGRLLGYSLLGGIAGLLGHQFFNIPPFSLVPVLAAMTLGLSFLYIGVQLWLGRSPHLFRLPPHLLIRIHRFGGNGPFIVGLLSAALPCGWLHTFVLGAVALQDPLRGMLYLFLFWLGTLPAMSLASLTGLRLFQPLTKKAPKLSGLLFIILGLLSIGIKMVPNEGQSACHSSALLTPAHHSIYH
jgi:sulfite exporter TauE/SafE